MRQFLAPLGATIGLLFTPLNSYAISLEQAVAHAIDSNPSVQQQYARYQSSLSLQDSARGGYYPQVRLTAGYGRENTRYNSGQKFDTRLNRSEIGLTVSQMLFNGFQTQADVKRLGKEAESEHYTLLNEAENTALEVCRVYLNLLKSEQINTLAKRNVEDHISAQDDIKERVDKGLSSKSDLAQINARLASARASLMAAQNNLFDLRAEYYSVVGTQPSELVDPINDALLIPASFEEALTQAQSQHPELKVATADIAAVKQEQRAAKHAYYPKFSAEFAANKSNDIGGFEGRDEDARLMLKMEYDLFNGGRDKHRAKASSWRYNEALAIDQRARREVEESIRLAWNANHFLSAQVDLYQESVEANSDAHTGYQQQFKLGRRSLLDLLDSQVELFLARRNYIEANYDQKLALYRINNAIGNLIESLRVTYPAPWDPAESER